MANKSLFASLKSRLVRADARNEAGGRAYKLDARHALAQLAAVDVAAVHLEVAVDNGAALALYRRSGFEQVGRRRGYYDRGGVSVDALVLRRALNTSAH